MAQGAPKGNEYYLIRNTDGREPIFKNPKELADRANEYFKFCIDNPLIEIDFKGKDATEVKLPRMRPFTMEGLCNHMEICVKTFHNYEKKEDFLQITTRIRQIIRNQKFEGAAAGFLNANIIARDLGLRDGQDITSKGDKIGEDLSKLSTEELVARANASKKIE